MAAVALGMGLGAGCVPPPPEPVTVRLVNTSGFVVDANVYLSNAAATAAQLFVSANFYDAWKGSRIFPTLQPGETVTFGLECDQATTLGVSQPIFTNLLGISTRSEDTVLLQRPGDFDCGQTVVFVYAADPNTEDYTVAGSVE